MQILESILKEDLDFGYELLKRLDGVVAEHLEATRLQLLDVCHG
jgi:hypothetical protein